MRNREIEVGVSLMSDNESARSNLDKYWNGINKKVTNDERYLLNTVNSELYLQADRIRDLCRFPSISEEETGVGQRVLAMVEKLIKTLNAIPRIEE